MVEETVEGTDQDLSEKLQEIVDELKKVESNTRGP